MVTDDGETSIVSDWKPYLQQYTKMIKTPTLQTYFSYIFIKIEAYTKPNNIWSLRFKLEVMLLMYQRRQQHFAEF
jgi:hypothetical protein